MKKLKILVYMLALCALLSACGAPAAGKPTPAPTPAPTTEPTAEPAVDGSAAKAAYADALEGLLTDRLLPDGTDVSADDMAVMEEVSFAVLDVDGDGREELILLYATGVMAGQTGFVLDYDEAAGELKTQLLAYPAFTFYDNGAVTADWSHNQGKGGAFWPYTLYVYDAGADAYQAAGSVDAWDESIGAEGYPADADTSGTGFVYYIQTGDEDWEDIAPVDESDYLAWRGQYVGGAELAPQYMQLSEENLLPLRQN